MRIPKGVLIFIAIMQSLPIAALFSSIGAWAFNLDTKQSLLIGLAVFLWQFISLHNHLLLEDKLEELEEKIGKLNK